MSGQAKQEFSETPGFCSATSVDKASLQKEIEKPEPKTSDHFATCNLPERFEHPHWFNGYGCQVSRQHPFYRTSASEYGWYAPEEFLDTSNRSRQQRFTEAPCRSIERDFKIGIRSFKLWDCNCTIIKVRVRGTYSDIHSVPMVFYPKCQKFTNHLAEFGMYRNYSLNTMPDSASMHK